MKTVLLTGVHGVGKGFFLEKIKENIQAYDVCSASELISQFKDATDGGYKRVTDVDSNQNVLLEAIQNRQKNAKKNILLDGHVCLLNAQGIVEPISEVFFQQANICGIVVLQDEVNEIHQRLKKRDEQALGVDIIGKIQTEEEKFAKLLKKELSIPYETITHACSGEQFENILKSMGEDK